MELRDNPHLLRKLPPRIYFLIGLLIILSLACNVPVNMTSSQDQGQPGFVETSVAETIAAGAENQPSGGEESTSDDNQSQISSATATPEVTFTPSLTPTQTLTPTPEVAKVYVSQNTNCRMGQGTSFQWLVTLLAGEESEAVGIDTSGDYWYIRRPDQPTGFCWLWGEYATPSGPWQSLPVYTPMPTPTPGFDFKITYHSNVGNCGWFWVLQYRIDNTGGFTLESWKSTTTDHTGGSDPIDNEQDKFYDISGCSPAGEQVDLTPGEAYYVNAVFDNNPQGHDLTVNIRICTEDGLGGDCLTKHIRHTP